MDQNKFILRHELVDKLHKGMSKATNPGTEYLVVVKLENLACKFPLPNCVEKIVNKYKFL